MPNALIVEKIPKFPLDQMVDDLYTVKIVGKNIGNKEECLVGSLPGLF